MLVKKNVLIMHPTDRGACAFYRCNFMADLLRTYKAGDSERRLEFRNPKIRIDEGKPEWGAEPKKLYFVITWEA